jgi:hypothetical protein
MMNYSDSMHGAGTGGGVLADGSRHSDITSSTAKGPDCGMNATLGRPKTGSDYSGPTPADVTTAPGQRTVATFGYGTTHREQAP